MADLNVPELEVAPGKRVIYTCMERGENELLLPFQNGEYEIMRAAGPTIQRWATDAIRAGKYQEVRFWTHGDCGADKTAWAFFKDGARISPRVTRWLEGAYGPLRIPKMRDLGQLEAEKLPFQKLQIEDHIGREVDTRFIRESELRRGTNEHHALVIAPPMFEGNYNQIIARLNEKRSASKQIEIGDVYFVHTANLKQVLPDIEVAARKLAEEVFVVSLKQDQDATLKAWAEALTEQPFMREIGRKPIFLAAPPITEPTPRRMRA